MKMFTLALLTLLIMPLVPLTRTNGKISYESHQLSRMLEEEIPGESEFQFNVETHNMYFKRISENLDSMEKAYTNCLDSLSDNNYNEDTVDSCIGKDMMYVLNDVDYERKQIVGRADHKIRIYMIEFCYKEADGNVEANSCDLLERDILTLLWNKLNFGILVDIHRHKYLVEAGQVPEHIFDDLVAYLQGLYTELVELIDEIDDHSIIVKANIKVAVDMRTRVILEQARENVRNPKPKIIRHKIDIEERINNPNFYNVDKLPRPLVQDGSTTMYVLPNNPDIDAFHRTYGDAIDDPDLAGPIITLPERRLNLETGSNNQ